jgi:hypothetical protein
MADAAVGRWVDTPGHMAGAPISQLAGAVALNVRYS